MFGSKRKKTDAVADTSPQVALRYYEADGALKANANKAWLLAFLTVPVALIAMVLAAMVRLQPPTVIQIMPNGESAALGQKTPDGKPSAAIAGADTFLNEAYIRRFLGTYLNYSPANVDDRWATSLNMMTHNLRAASLRAMQDDDLISKIDDGQISSVFHLREISSETGEPLTYMVYGVKEVHRVRNGGEVTDHYVNEYRIRLVADQRTNANPDGLWVADYSESSLDGERRNQILAAPDSELN
jgi:hypothetical protein